MYFVLQIVLLLVTLHLYFWLKAQNENLRLSNLR